MVSSDELRSSLSSKKAGRAAEEAFMARGDTSAAQKLGCLLTPYTGYLVVAAGDIRHHDIYNTANYNTANYNTANYNTVLIITHC